MTTVNPRARSSSPEDKAFQESYDLLVKSIQQNYSSLGDALYSRGLILKVLKNRLLGGESDDNKARSILNSIDTLIEQDPQYYHRFVDVLKAQGPYNNSIVERLKNCFESHSTKATTKSSETNTSTKVIIKQEIDQENSSANASCSEIEECVAPVHCVDDYDVTQDNTQIILPSLQLNFVPKRLTGRAQHAHPKPFVHPAEVPRVGSILPEDLSNTLQEGSQRKSDSIQTPGVANLNMGGADFQLLPQLDSFQPYGLAPMNRHHSPAQIGGATSIQPSHGAFVHTFTAEQAVGEAQQSSRRQANLRQGTVLYTSVPDKIPCDRIQPLPTQHTLIRKGGNGSIFSDLAVKKTSYRSKEYAIITKIRHKNIVPLLAYVCGEEHKESKRRFFVYHYLPKLSGDMARLVTDKEELSLHDFHKRHHNNPRAMGVAVGNVKYILSQVLQGLNYLHDNHQCIHRDVKASNVLIKFFCNCDNPVQCSCDVKYQVVICDFDAALELDSSSCTPALHSKICEEIQKVTPKPAVANVLPQDVAQLENGLKQTQTELSEQKKQNSRVLDQLRETVTQLVSDTEQQRSTLRQLTSVDHFTQTFPRMETVLEELNLKIEILEVKSTSGVYIWKVNDLARRAREARIGRTVSLYSPPFYTSPHGYRLCLRAYLFGDGSGKGTHISLFIVVMKSEYDDLLAWPFQHKVTLTLINQDHPLTPERSTTHRFIPNADSSSFKKSVDTFNLLEYLPPPLIHHAHKLNSSTSSMQG